MARTPEHEVDEMKRLLRKSGWIGGPGNWQHFATSDEFTAAAEESGRKEGISEGRNQLARDVIRAFGLSESYPDVTEERQGTRTAYDPYDFAFTYRTTRRYRSETYIYTHTTPGSVAFIRDVTTAAEGSNVEEARKRLGVSGKK